MRVGMGEQKKTGRQITETRLAETRLAETRISRAMMSAGSWRRGSGSSAGLPALALVAVLLFTGSHRASAQSASTLNSRGLKAEERQDYDAAFEDYRQAHLKKPGDLRYRTRFERTRFLAASLHIDRGRVLRQSGDLTGAINEFARALEIDPGDETASQELQLTEKSQQAPANPATPGSAAARAGVAPADSPNANAPKTSTPQASLNPIPGQAEQTPYQRRVQEDLSTLGSPVTLQPIDNDPITLDMVEDVKNIYQAIGKIAGLNVIFDPDYTSKRIAVNLHSVSLNEALRIVGMQSNTFWKPVTSNVLLVAANTRDRRTAFEDQAVQTFYLTNVSQANDANEVQIALRNLLDPSVKIYLVNSQNAIVLRASPDQLILAEKLINDLDRVHSEVIVDVAVLEVSRDKIRNLGITLPTSFGLTPTSCTSGSTNCSNSSTNSGTSGTSGTAGSGTSGTGTSGTSGSTNTSNLTLNSLGNLNATNFQVSVSGGTVNALLSDSDTRILQNPRIRATDGQKATLKIGSKIPVATGSYSSTLSTTASLGVQTQFTYIDVGVNIDMTPTVHYDREVSLKMKIEVSADTNSVTIDSVTEPIISQRVVEQTIQLKDGEPSILAGILQRQDTRTVNGTPGLGEIPFLKYFFSTQGKENQSDEIVFLLIPHIVRENLLTAENTRAIYTGPSQSIELIRRPPPAMVNRPAPTVSPGSTSAANAANAMIGEIARAGAPPEPPKSGAPPSPSMAGPSGAPSASAPVTLAVVPSSAAQTVGSTFQVSVTAANARDLSSIPLAVHFDPKILSLVSVDSGALLARDGKAVSVSNHDEGNGTTAISLERPLNAPGITGDGPVCTLTFKAVAAGDSTVSLVRIGARDSKNGSLAAVGLQGVVHVK